MIALPNTGQYPLGNSAYRWIKLDTNNTTTVTKPLYIFVDASVAEYLTQHKILLKCSRLSEHVITASIKSVNGNSPNKTTIDGLVCKTLSEIITGKKGAVRGPKHTYHANDWTAAAFDRTVTEPSPSGGDTIYRPIDTTPTTNVISTTNVICDITNDDATEADHYKKTLDHIIQDFEDSISCIYTPTQPSNRVPWYTVLGLVASVLMFWWIV